MNEQNITVEQILNILKIDKQYFESQIPNMTESIKNTMESQLAYINKLLKEITGK